jgi:hypothetical protein
VPATPPKSTPVTTTAGAFVVTGSVAETVVPSPSCLVRRYYNNPNPYSISEGRLSCAALWGVQIENDSPDHVVAVGRRISEASYRRSFHSQWAEITNPEQLLKLNYLTSGMSQLSTTLKKWAIATFDNEATCLSFGQSAGSWVLMHGRLPIPRPRSALRTV